VSTALALNTLGHFILSFLGVDLHRFNAVIDGAGPAAQGLDFEIVSSKRLRSD
jgi:hypothetical protein